MDLKAKELYEKAREFGKNNQYELALEHYEAALKIDPSFADAWNGKGHVLYAQEKYREAFQCYKKAFGIHEEAYWPLIDERQFYSE